MKNQIIKIESTQQNDILNIRWTPNNICNFKCTYCFPDAHAGTYKSPPDLDLIIKNFQNLFNYYKVNLKKNKFHLHISGGEPTLWPDLGAFIKQIKQNHNVYISIVSNGSRTVRWWKEYGSFIDNAILSFHVAQADIDHHIAVSDMLYSLGKKVTVLVLMDPVLWKKSVDSVDYMKSKSKHSWFIQAKEIVDYYSYNESQKNFLSSETKRRPNIVWFIKHYKLLFDGSLQRFESKATQSNGSPIFAGPNTYINRDSNDFFGWKCHIGLESIYIHWTGDIQGACGQILFEETNSYNILDRDFIEKFHPRLIPSQCSKSKCICSPETHITKYIV